MRRLALAPVRAVVRALALAPVRAAMRALALAAVLVGAACATFHFVPDRAHGFIAREEAGHRYHAWVPADWSRDRSWPVIVYLHGGGERGDDGVQPTQVGMGPVLWNSEGRFPFIVLFPQCMHDHFWTEPAMEARVLAAIDWAVRELGGDPKRIYLTGNSMGGYATYVFGLHHPDRFAALVPICGGIVPPFRHAPAGSVAAAEDPYRAAAQALARKPIWVFHGAADFLVPVRVSHKIVRALHEAGNPARYTEYPDVGHSAERRAYLEPGLFEWLAAQHL